MHVEYYMYINYQKILMENSSAVENYFLMLANLFVILKSDILILKE